MADTPPNLASDQTLSFLDAVCHRNGETGEQMRCSYTKSVGCLSGNFIFRRRPLLYIYFRIFLIAFRESAAPLGKSFPTGCCGVEMRDGGKKATEVIAKISVLCFIVVIFADGLQELVLNTVRCSSIILVSDLHGILNAICRMEFESRIWRFGNVVLLLEKAKQSASTITR